MSAIRRLAAILAADVAGYSRLIRAIPHQMCEWRIRRDVVQGTPNRPRGRESGFMIPSLKGCKSPAISYLQGNNSTGPL